MKERTGKFVIVGVIGTIFDYAVYTFCSMVLFGGNADMLWAAGIISGFFATWFAYFMHSRITWKERDPGKYGVIKFFAWNAFAIMVCRPVVINFLRLLGGLYAFAYGVFEFLNIPFSYEFVESTGIYCLMTGIIMVLNFLVYEKLIFGADSSGKAKGGKEVEMESVGQAGKEEKRSKKTQD